MNISEHFTRSELECSHCGELPEEYGEELAGFLESVRSIYGRAMRITSGYRCLEHPIENGKPEGATHAHTFHKAADIACEHADALALIVAGLTAGARGFGVSQRGRARFIHLDLRDGPVKLWSYA